jgi:hypothetical protein
MKRLESLKVARVRVRGEGGKNGRGFLNHFFHKLYVEFADYFTEVLLEF